MCSTIMKIWGDEGKTNDRDLKNMGLKDLMPSMKIP